MPPRAAGRSRRRSRTPQRRGCRIRGRPPDSVEHLDRVPLAQVFGQPVLETLLDRLLVERLLDLVARLVEGTVSRRLDLVDAQDVEAAVGPHHVAQLTGREREHRRLHVGFQLSAREGSEQAALVRAGAFGELLGELLEGATADRQLPYLLGLAVNAFDLLRVVDRLHAEEYVAHGDALTGPELLAVDLVVVLHLFRRHADAAADLLVDELGLL